MKKYYSYNTGNVVVCTIMGIVSLVITVGIVAFMGL